MYNVQGIEACKIDVQGMSRGFQGEKKVSKWLLKLAKLMSRGLKKINVQGKTQRVQGLKFVRLMSRG